MNTHEKMITQGAAVLSAGKPLIFPTDTVYGLGLAINCAPSPQLLYELKGRIPEKPVAWLVAHPQDLYVYGTDISAMADALAQRYWPGPLTLIVKASDHVPAAFRTQDGSIALRMPNSAFALELIRRVGCPVATTSANISGCSPAQHATDLAPELTDRVDCVFLEEEPTGGLPSSVIDCTDGEPIIVRAGAITAHDIQPLKEKM